MSIIWVPNGGTGQVERHADKERWMQCRGTEMIDRKHMSYAADLGEAGSRDLKVFQLVQGQS
jgi:hypothetical protein